MRGLLAKFLVALAVTASLLLGLPGQGLADQPTAAPAATDLCHEEPHQQHMGDHAQHMSASQAPLDASHHQAPAAGGDDCRCQPASCSSILSMSAGTALVLTFVRDDAAPAIDQMPDSGAFLPPLRPPRA